MGKQNLNVPENGVDELNEKDQEAYRKSKKEEKNDNK